MLYLYWEMILRYEAAFRAPYKILTETIRSESGQTPFSRDIGIGWVEMLLKSWEPTLEN